MAYLPLPPAETIRQLVDYNPETGIFIWKPRTAEHMAHGRYGPKSNALNWNNRYAGKRADSSKGGFHKYRYIHLRGKVYKAHRIAWAYHYGWEPIGQIDHINGDKSDNRIANIRDVSPSLNSRNVGRKVIGKSGILCVTQTAKGRWAVVVSRTRIGTYDDLATAIVARDAAWKALGVTEQHGRVGIEFRRKAAAPDNQVTLPAPH